MKVKRGGAGRCQPVAEGKGVCGDEEFEGSRMQSSAPRNTKSIRHVRGMSLPDKTLGSGKQIKVTKELLRNNLIIFLKNPHGFSGYSKKYIR